MSIDDMTTPDGWQIRVAPGWGLWDADDANISRVAINAYATVPVALRMSVINEEKRIVTLLFFFVIDKEAVLSGAINLSTRRGLLDDLKVLWSVRPKAWWGRKVLYSLTTPSDDASGDVDERVQKALESVQQMPMTRRKDRVTDEVLTEVAEVYRSAIANGANPTQAVANRFYKSHSTAARWVMRARKAGHLGPANGRKGGELTSSEEPRD